MPTFHPHLMITLLRPMCSNSSCPVHVQKTFKEYQMATQFEETVQASGTDIIGMLELTDLIFQKNHD